MKNPSWRQRLLREFYGTAAYDHFLRGRPPADLALRLPVRWPGDPRRGEEILAGEFSFAGQTLREPVPVWAPPEATPAFLEELHSFSWLADLAALASDKARRAGAAFIAHWLGAEGKRWHPLSWRADILASRIVAWIAYFDEFIPAGNGETGFRSAVLESLARQLRHLARVAATEVTGAARFTALKGLVMGHFALGAAEAQIGRALERLGLEMITQIHPDGGTIERSPVKQLAILKDLVDIRTMLRAAAYKVPDELQAMIDNAAGMLRFFRHGDGRLSHFNGAAEQYGGLVDLVLSRAESGSRPPVSAPQTGFQRLQAGKTLLLVDTGAPPPSPFDTDAHAGTLSFEMSWGKERIIVNCGGYRGPSPLWRTAARSTAAHSTLIVEDTNSAEILEDGSIGHRPAILGLERAEEAGAQWVAVSHDGYAARFGVTHSRQIFLSADGDDLRGKDRLAGRAGGNFVIRFHLHPSVQVSRIQDGAVALLRLPSGTGWRLRVEGGQMSLAESIYLGGGERIRSQQLVLAGYVGTEGAEIRWGLKRETRNPPETLS